MIGKIIPLCANVASAFISCCDQLLAHFASKYPIVETMDENEEREGQDITIEHMTSPEAVPSEIQKFYRDGVIFITGVTGSLGKILLEKLLRTCDVRRIYVLMRRQGDVVINQRFTDLIESPIFDQLKRKRPNFCEKVFLVDGDCALPDFGIDALVRRRLANEVNCIFHCATLTNCEDRFQLGIDINVRAVQEVIKLAKVTVNLQALVHMSTAFSNFPLRIIDEIFYDDDAISSDKIFALANYLSDDEWKAVTPVLLGKWPNIYLLTKAIAEGIVKKESSRLPVAIIRPSLVTAAYKEPLAGWTDNFNGPTGIMLGVTLGIIRTVFTNVARVNDIVPVDYVVNCTLAVAWSIASKRSAHANEEIPNSPDANEAEKNSCDVPIYNYVSSTENPVKAEDLYASISKYGSEIPSRYLIWHQIFLISNSYVSFIILEFLLHTVPAYIGDFLSYCLGKPHGFVEKYRNVGKKSRELACFLDGKWRFNTGNSQKLWKQLNSEDRKLFPFDVKNVNWDEFCYLFTRASRVYLLKDPIETVALGRQRYYSAKVIHYGLIATLGLFIFVLFRLFLF